MSHASCDVPTAFVYGCSPRRGGNSDLAAGMVQEELTRLNISSEIIFVRDVKLMPCRGCQMCFGTATGGLPCVSSNQDEAAVLFSPLLAGKRIFFISPIYFYHLPALFKNFIDRAQAYWVMRECGCASLQSLPRRKAHVILIAARENGEKLFQGSLLSLRFFLKPFNIELAEPLLLRGVDDVRDLALNEAAKAQIISYTRQAGHSY